MSIAISLKVHDGVVLAADSASTLIMRLPQGATIPYTVYNNANKIFNLRKGFPIGCVTYGAGSIGNASIATLFKDFRQQITTGWLTGDQAQYSIEDVTKKLANFLNEEIKKDSQVIAPLGVTVSGYSSGSNLADEWSIEINGADSCVLNRVRVLEECGIRWGGQGEVVQRLVMGFSPVVSNVLNTVAADQKTAAMLLNAIQQQAAVPLIQPAMPIQDAIDLARFLVETTISFTRFMPGVPVVGGPVEIAAITKHEGFKWITRKHYWSHEFNREVQ